MRLELEAEASDALKTLIELNSQQLVALAQNDQAQLLVLDKKMENVFGAKERSFGAWRQHIKEHGCSRA